DDISSMQSWIGSTRQLSFRGLRMELSSELQTERMEPEVCLSLGTSKLGDGWWRRDLWQGQPKRRSYMPGCPVLTEDKEFLSTSSRIFMVLPTTDYSCRTALS